MILDCLSPGVPAGAMRVTVLSTAGVLRALCGVAGGSSKASLSAHFAKWGNLAELNAVCFKERWGKVIRLMICRKIHLKRLSFHSLACWYVQSTKLLTTLLAI